MPLGVFSVIGIGMTQRKLKVFVLLPVGFFIINNLRQTSFSDFDSFAMLWLGLFVAALFVLFNYLLKATTPFGRKLIDEIEGFKLYLSTAEQHRLNALHPAKKTPELFENLLPYAIALGVENEWSEQFTEILVRSAVQQATYRPGWYSGNRTGFKPTSRGFALGSGLQTGDWPAVSHPRPPRPAFLRVVSPVEVGEGGRPHITLFQIRWYYKRP